MQLGPIANISQALLGLRPWLVGGGDTAGVTTRYGLLHYDYLTCRTGPFIFLSYYLI